MWMDGWMDRYLMRCGKQMTTEQIIDNDSYRQMVKLVSMYYCQALSSKRNPRALCSPVAFVIGRGALRRLSRYSLIVMR